MDSKVRVMIVDDNVRTGELLSEFIQRQDDMHVVGIASNGVLGLEMIQEEEPDVVILDMVMPRMDGLGVLERMESLRLNNPPEVICLSAVGHEQLIKRAIELGARYYIVKPFDMDTIVRRIRDLSGGSNPHTSYQPIKKKAKNLDEKITTIFLTIGIPAHIKGYYYLREAIKMVVENNSIINRITKELYPNIGIQFKTSSSKVERAIRHAIDVAWSRGKMENINQIFGYVVYGKNDKPTNGEFIALIADKLSMEESA